jgi:hypothetical protein
MYIFSLLCSREKLVNSFCVLLLIHLQIKKNSESRIDFLFLLSFTVIGRFSPRQTFGTVSSHKQRRLSEQLLESQAVIEKLPYFDG